MTGKYGIGLDIGIGYVGFAVLADTDGVACVEDFGVRLFASGKTADHKEPKNHERRRYRNIRRLYRRRSHRKERVKNFLEKINFISRDAFKIWQEKNDRENIFFIRLKGLSEKLTAGEITACVIHICNHRGYGEYHDEADSKEAGLVREGLAEFEERFKAGGYKSVADMILNDDAFKTATNFPDYHNHKNSDRYILVKRAYVRKELLDILHVQTQYYPQLTEGNINFLCDRIVFAQRDFETGPGNENDKLRKFMGFLDSVGRCSIYKEEKRAFRTTVISDIYALVSCLSQYTYINEENYKINLPKEAAKAILDYALHEADISEKQVKVILKGFGLKLVRKGKAKVKLADTVATLKVLRKCLEKSGYDYTGLISEEQFKVEVPSTLQRMSVLLCENITPKRRMRALRADGWSDELCKALQHKRFGGTTKVCERYMVDVIKAFLNGESIGNVKARLLQERSANVKVKRQKFLPAFTKTTDEEIAKDVVTFKAINESRKIINAIVGKYGSPTYINVEIDDGLKRFTYYIVNYLNDNLYFASNEDKNIHIVKRRIASAMCEQILGSGHFTDMVKEDDTKLRYAVKAVGLANLTFANEQRYENIKYAKGLRMPLVSYKQNKKFQGQLTDDNPVAKEKRKASSLVRVDENGNETVWSASKYYCVEIYKDREKRTALRGIRYVDLAKKNKKLYLAVPYPENYFEHVMYLFQNDYISISDAKGNEKFVGFYRSVKAVTRNLLNVRKVLSDVDEYIYVRQKDVFKKYDVDVLGRLGGEVKSSVPFRMLPQED